MDHLRQPQDALGFTAMRSNRPSSSRARAEWARLGRYHELGLSDERELSELDQAVREHLADPRTLALAHLLVVTWGRKPPA